jgi:hypothetical protein
MTARQQWISLASHIVLLFYYCPLYGLPIWHRNNMLGADPAKNSLMKQVYGHFVFYYLALA